MSRPTEGYPTRKRLGGSNPMDQFITDLTGSSKDKPKPSGGKSGGGKSGGGKSRGGGGGGGGGGKTTYTQTIKGDKATAKSHRRQVRLLKQLADSRREGMDNLQAQYDNALSRNRNVRRSVVADLLEGQRSAMFGYDRSERDASSNLGNTVSSSQLNRAREGMSAMAELSNMQAGETDRIRGMAASIRGMKANMDGGASDYANAITSINNSLGDLNSTVRTNINNALREEDASNAAAFGEWTTGLQQGYSDLVDLYGQVGAEQEQVADSLATKKSKTRSSGTKNVKTTQTNDTIYKGTGGKKALGGAKDSFAASADAAATLSDLQGRMYTGSIMTIDEMNASETDPNMRFTPAEMKANQSNLDDLSNAGTLRKLAGPEGSKLRKAVV